MEVACYGYEGIDAVKEALRAGLSLSTEDSPIKINLIAPPTYVMTTTTLERVDGLKLLSDALNLIKERIEKHDSGKFNIQMAVSGSASQPWVIDCLIDRFCLIANVILDCTSV